MNLPPPEVVQESTSPLRVNIGCGQTPTPGFLNFDNSLSVRLARYPVIARLVASAGLLGKDQNDFVSFVRKSSILWADAVRHIPLRDGSADLVYTSHMIEHFDRAEVSQFLREAKRVLGHNGIVRLVVPDLAKLVDRYTRDRDADSFVASTLLAHARPKTQREKLMRFITGDRHHLWMYDASSLCRLLEEAGFRNARALAPGETTIPSPGSLDLRERAAESVYVEAAK